MQAKETLRRQQEIDDLKAVMSTEEGRRFVWRILRDAGIFSSSFVGGSPDITAFKEGARNLGLNLLAEITTEAPDSYLIMQKEATEYEKKQRYLQDQAREEALRDSGGGDTDD